MIQDVCPGYFGVAWYWLSFEPRCLPTEYGLALARGPAAPLPPDWQQTVTAIDYVAQ
jgi:hypothetical protein